MQAVANLVFPTDVGMNRSMWMQTTKEACVPHRRGDEPQSLTDDYDVVVVFPTDVGMNRAWLLLRYRIWGVPHRRGDEP